MLIFNIFPASWY